MPVPQWFARLARALAGRRLIAPTDRTLRATTSAPPPARDAAAFTLAKDTEWTDSRKAPLDPRLRVAFALLRHPDPKLVLDYTGIRLPAAQRSDAARAAALAVPVHVDLARPLDKEVSDELARANITLPGAYLDEAARNAGLRHVTGLLHTPLPTGIAVKEMSERLRAAVDLGVIERIALPAPALPCGALHEGETFAAIGMPPERKVVVDGEAIVADGTGVIVGIIDDGVCLAHANFIDDSLRSRILSIWDQGASRVARIGRRCPTSPTAASSSTRRAQRVPRRSMPRSRATCLPTAASTKTRSTATSTTSRTRPSRDGRSIRPRTARTCWTPPRATAARSAARRAWRVMPTSCSCSCRRSSSPRAARCSPG